MPYTFRRTESGHWVRSRPRQILANGTADFAFCVDNHDTTPNQSRSEYVAECGFCWLGSPHSSAIHAVKAAGK